MKKEGKTPSYTPTGPAVPVRQSVRGPIALVPLRVTFFQPADRFIDRGFRVLCEIGSAAAAAPAAAATAPAHGAAQATKPSDGPGGPG